jgi:hypothetical protein
MKLIGAIAILVLLATACQKEDIRPTSPASTAVRTESSGTTLTDDEGTVPSGGEGITDPNDANRNSKNPKPKQ